MSFGDANADFFWNGYYAHYNWNTAGQDNPDWWATYCMGGDL